MGLEHAKEGKLLYHLTELKNLESIILKGLQSRKMLLENGVLFTDIADPNIISERKILKLDQYIPFHFHTYSAFDVAVKNKHINEAMVYICIHRDYAKNNNFKILPYHPLSNEKYKLYDYDAGMEEIDWDTLMEVGSQADGAKNIKMAECLSDMIIPASHFQSIAVATQKDKKYVERLFVDCNIDYPPPYIDVKPIWF